MDNPWVLCLGVMHFPTNWGKVTEETKSGAVFVLYSERQMYSEQCWSGDYVKRFGTPEELLSELTKCGRWSRTSLINEFAHRFPNDKLDKDSIAEAV